MNPTENTVPALTVGSKVRVVKGCNARRVTKGATVIIKAIEPLGADYGHQVKVTLWFQNSFLAGKTLSFYVRHANRISDVIVGMNDGRPEHRIEVCRV